MVRLLKTAIMRLTLGSQPQAPISSCRQNLSNPVNLFLGSQQWRGYPVTDKGLLHLNRLAVLCQEKRALSFSTNSRVWTRMQQCLADEKDSGSLEHERSHKACGEIHLILGPMFAGKTTALLKSMDAEMKAGRKTVLVKSDKDTRYGLTAVVSHDGMEMPCRAVSSLTKFKAEMGEQYKETDVIGIDEAQFFKDLFSFCQEAADLDGKTVFVAGLDGDFLRRSFGSALDLIPLAESVTKLSARCEICQKPAAFTFRKTGDERTEVIGGADVYMPVCRQHYVSGQVALEAARTVLELNQPYQTCGKGNLQL